MTLISFQIHDCAEQITFPVSVFSFVLTFQQKGFSFMSVQVKDINLTVGTGMGVGESIIQDVKGLSVVIQRSLRDLLHQIPTTEAAIRVIAFSLVKYLLLM